MFADTPRTILAYCTDAWELCVGVVPVAHVFVCMCLCGCVWMCLCVAACVCVCVCHSWLLESASTSTRTNALFSLDIMKAKG